jgi:hemerythrin superfamily protein
MLGIVSFNLPKSVRPFVTTVNTMVKISESIVHDHKELKEYYGNIKSAKDDDTKKRWRNQFVWELARHSIAEELVVYPAMEKYIKPGGHDMAEKDRQEHQVVNSVHERL